MSNIFICFNMLEVGTPNEDDLVSRNGISFIRMLLDKIALLHIVYTATIFQMLIFWIAMKKSMDGL